MSLYLTSKEMLYQLKRISADHDCSEIHDPNSGCAWCRWLDHCKNVIEDNKPGLTNVGKLYHVEGLENVNSR